MGFIKNRDKSISARNIVGGFSGNSAGSVVSGGGLSTSKEVLQVHCVSVSNITLSGEQTVDGYSAVSGNIVLVAGQTDDTENGIYTVSATAWSLNYSATPSTSPLLIIVQNGTEYAEHLFERVSNDMSLYKDIGEVYPSTELPDGVDANEILTWNNSTNQWDISPLVQIGGGLFGPSDNRGYVYLTQNGSPNNSGLYSDKLSFIDDSGDSYMTARKFKFSPDSTDSNQYLEYITNYIFLKNGSKFLGLENATTPQLNLSYTSGTGEYRVNGLRLNSGLSDETELTTTVLKIGGRTSTKSQKAIWDKDGQMVWVRNDADILDTATIFSNTTFPASTSIFRISPNFTDYKAIVRYKLIIDFPTLAAATDGIAFKLDMYHSTPPKQFDVIGENIYNIYKFSGETISINSDDGSGFSFASDEAGLVVVEGSYNIEGNEYADGTDLALFFRKLTGTDNVTIDAGSRITIDFYNA